MEYKQITDLIRLINKTNVAELSIEQGDFKMRLRTAEGIAARSATVVPAAIQAPAPAAAPAVAPAADPAPAPVAAPAASASPEGGSDEASAAESGYIEVTSPMVGTFYRRPNPESEPFVSVGDTISEGQVLCVIEAMKLFNEIEAEVSGKVVKVFPEDSSPVEFEQPLFLIDPKG
jgi:acetyl-CoA carboxylase biotin carboxyl carrier protein